MLFIRFLRTHIDMLDALYQFRLLSSMHAQHFGLLLLSVYVIFGVVCFDIYSIRENNDPFLPILCICVFFLLSEYVAFCIILATLYVHIQNALNIDLEQPFQLHFGCRFILCLPFIRRFDVVFLLFVLAFVEYVQDNCLALYHCLLFFGFASTKPVSLLFYCKLWRIQHCVSYALRHLIINPVQVRHNSILINASLSRGTLIRM